MRIYHITINSIDYERRIHNQVETALKQDYKIRVIAYGKTGEKHLEHKNNFLLIRLKTGPINSGPLKFIIFNIKLFFTLFLKPVAIIHCHDLWVLPAAAMLSLLKSCLLIYDAHEYYAGLQIFNKRFIRKKIWLFCEWVCMPVIDIFITISEPLGKFYKERYRRLGRVEVIRNLPKFEELDREKAIPLQLQWPIKKDLKNIIFHGHFKPGRGLENLIKAMALVENVSLVLIGGGELKEDLIDLVNKKNIQKKVRFVDYIHTELLISTIAQADIGAVLFEPTSINYAHALPNKFFEYIMAGVPILGSNIITIDSYVKKYELGRIVDPSQPQFIAKTIEDMINDETKLKMWKKNCKKAAKQLNWEVESKKLVEIYEQIHL